MEGLAALSVAANIFQFLEYGLRLVAKAKTLRDAGSVSPDLAIDAQRLKNIASDLRQPAPGAGDYRQLIIECSQVSETLIAELEKLKPKDPRSRWHGFKAIVKSEVKKSRLQELETRLEKCRSQLELHLIQISRDETNEKLTDIAANGDLVRSQLAKLNLVVKDLQDSEHVGQDILRSLREVIQQYDESLMKARQEIILDLLRFADMHERFDIVADADETTFRWLFDDEPQNLRVASSEAKLTEADEKFARYEFRDYKLDDSTKSRVRSDFIRWLREGNGFFHICGKPGAGKSTLMKYICLHSALQEHLKSWSQAAELCVGRFFFWRPGSAAQKSLKGLLRGLVFSLLSDHPHMIPVAFPELWNLSLGQFSLSRTLEQRDLEQALASLLSSAHQNGSAKFALFIDGLDEFDGRHLDLIRTMQKWAEGYPDILKICVSSREYSVFQESFAPYPKMRLHELTYMDIAKMVFTRLSANTEYVSLVSSEDSQQYETSVDDIVRVVTESAEGVFLWVSLALTAVEDGLLSGDSLYELKQKVETFPKELEALYQHLMQSIHPADRRWAFTALKLVKFLQTNPASSILLKATLLQLSFLDDLSWNCSVFDKIRAQDEWSDDIQKRFRNTYKKVTGRCKGFLEVQFSTLEKSDVSVVLTHRSLVEFLESATTIEMMRPYVSDFDGFEVASHTLLSLLKYLPSKEGILDGIEDSNPRGLTLDVLYLDRAPRRLILIMDYIHLAIQAGYSRSERFFTFLDYMGRIFSDRLKQAGVDISDIILDPCDWFILFCFTRGAISYTKARLAQLLQRLQSPLQPSFVFLVFRSLYYSAWVKIYDDRPDTPQHRSLEAMNILLSLGLDLNTEKIHDSNFQLLYRGLTPWQTILCDLLPKPQHKPGRCYGPLIDCLLRHGADPNLTIGRLFTGESRQRQWLDTKGELKVFRPFSDADNPHSMVLQKGRILGEPGATIFYFRPDLEFSKVMEKHGGLLTLPDLLELWFPDDHVYFRNLIDALQSGQPDGKGLPESPYTSGDIMPAQS